MICRHAKCWAICGGVALWCPDCGAWRHLNLKWRGWVYPKGQDAATKRLTALSRAASDARIALTAFENHIGRQGHHMTPLLRRSDLIEAREALLQLCHILDSYGVRCSDCRRVQGHAPDCILERALVRARRAIVATTQPAPSAQNGTP